MYFIKYYFNIKNNKNNNKNIKFIIILYLFL